MPKERRGGKVVYIKKASAKESGDGKIGTSSRTNPSLSDIPQSFLERVQRNNPDADMNVVANAWRKRYAESVSQLTNVKDLKVGDKIAPSRLTVGDDGSIHNVDEHAYWNVKKSDGTTSKQALEAMSNFSITNIEKRKDGVKITAIWEIGKDYQLKGKDKDNALTVTRVFKADDRVRRQ